MKIDVRSLFHRYYLLLLFLLLIPVTRSRVELNLRGVIWSDCEGYFAYLPAVFDLHNIHALPEGSMNARKNAQGEVVIKYTCGVAYFQLPFFLAAKAYCSWRHWPKEDIYNIHYSRAMACAGYVAAFLGLFFLQRALRRRGFKEPTVLLTLLAILCGTNLFHYATKEMGMSHAYSFMLFAFVAWRLPFFYEKPSWKNAAILGGALGWILLIRPTNALILLFVLLYDVYNWPDLRGRLVFWRKNIPKLALAVGVGFLFLVPQLLYWHAMTGEWLRYSYEGEEFIYCKAPKILAVLFDSQNGLFVYSPLVLLALPGMVAGWRERRADGPANLLIFTWGTYLFASWWAWWFGGAFGHRSYVELYALMAFPLALMLEKLLTARNLLWRAAGLVVVLFLIFYSVRMSFLYQHLPGPWDGADWRWSWKKMVWVWSHLFDFLH